MLILMLAGGDRENEVNNWLYHICVWCISLMEITKTNTYIDKYL